MRRTGTPFPLYLAQRYLRSTRRDAFITFLTVTAAGGIALGVAALILSSAALTGFQDVLRSEVLARTPHVEATLPVGVDLEAAVEAAAEVDGVESVQPWMRGRGWVLAAGRSRPIEIIGFLNQLPQQFPGAKDRAPGVYVSHRLSQSWGLEPGQVVEIVAARPTLTPLGPQPRVLRRALVGTFEAGRTEQEERIALPLGDAVQLLGANDRRLLITTGDLDQAVGVAERVADVLPAGATVQSWRDLNQALLFLLRLEKSLMFIAVFLIVVVAAMAVISDLMLIQAHKQSEMGMLAAMGADSADLRRIYLWLGGLLVSVGAILGSLLGILGALFLDRFEILTLPGDVYFLDHVPFLVRPREVSVILLATVALTLACSWLAASRAAALRPVEALHR